MAKQCRNVRICQHGSDSNIMLNNNILFWIPGVLCVYTGTITSPGYPATFSSFLNHTQRIVVHEGIVVLVFEDIDIGGPHTDCDCSYIRVFEVIKNKEEDKTIICQYSNNNILNLEVQKFTFKASFRELFVEIVSKCGNDTYRGFKARYTQSFSSNYEPLVLKESEGLVVSPNFPAFSNTQDSSVTIEAPSGYMVRLNFVYFHSFMSCSAAELVLYDGDSEDEDKLISLCHTGRLVNVYMHHQVQDCA